MLTLIRDLLLLLEAPLDPSGSKNRDEVFTSFKVPTLETISEVYPQGEQQNWLYTESHVNLKDISRIPTIILHLISVLLPQNSPKSQHVIKRVPPDSAWLVETLARLFSILGLETLHTPLYPFTGHRLVLFLTILTGSISCAVHRRSENILVSQLIILLGQSLRIFLSVSFSDTTPSLEDVVLESVSNLCSIFSKSSVCLEAFYKHLKPIIQETVEIADFHEKNGEKFQVRYLIISEVLCTLTCNFSKW